jgi:hypothetical protein
MLNLGNDYAQEAQEERGVNEVEGTIVETLSRDTDKTIW